jgi:hypothetical protein
MCLLQSRRVSLDKANGRRQPVPTPPPQPKKEVRDDGTVAADDGGGEGSWRRVEAYGPGAHGGDSAGGHDGAYGGAGAGENLLSGWVCPGVLQGD